MSILNSASLALSVNLFKSPFAVLSTKLTNSVKFPFSTRAIPSLLSSDSRRPIHLSGYCNESKESVKNCPLKINEHGKTFDAISLIEMNFSGGQRKSGTDLAPPILTQGILKQLDLQNTANYGIIKVNLEDLENDRSAISCSLAAQRISKAVSTQAAKNNFCFNLGGDHSVGTGTLSGLMEVYPDLFVIWIDAHADINTYHTSTTKNFHGMPVSFLVDDAQLQTDKIREYSWTDKYLLKPQNLVYIGLRDVDPEEQVTLDRLNITHFPMHKINDKTINQIMQSISNLIKKNQPVHVSFDVDGLDPELTPSTGTAVNNGISIKQMMQISDFVRTNFNLVGIDLVEVNPSLGNKSDVARTLKNSILTSCNFIKKQD